MKFRSFSFLAAAFAAVLCVAGTAVAHDDILATKFDGGTTTGIGAFEVDEGEVELDSRVFEGIFVAGGSDDFARDEPGVAAPASTNPLFGPAGDLTTAGATPLGSGEQVVVTIKTFSFEGSSSDLFFWDGTGATVNFQPITTVTPSVTPSTGIASSNGSLDFHPDFAINATSGTAADGVYLMAVTLTAGTAAESELGYIVWLADSGITSENDAEDAEGDIEAGTAFVFYEEAVEHVEATIPEPTSLALVSLLALAAVSARRK